MAIKKRKCRLLHKRMWKQWIGWIISIHAYRKRLVLANSLFIALLPLVYMRSPIMLYKQDFTSSIFTESSPFIGLLSRQNFPTILHITLWKPINIWNILINLNTHWPTQPSKILFAYAQKHPCIIIDNDQTNSDRCQAVWGTRWLSPQPGRHQRLEGTHYLWMYYSSVWAAISWQWWSALTGTFSSYHGLLDMENIFPNTNIEMPRRC